MIVVEDFTEELSRQNKGIGSDRLGSEPAAGSLILPEQETVFVSP